MKNVRYALWVPLYVVMSSFWLVSHLHAQPTFTNLPASTSNTRFFSDVFSINRPALSLHGFDSELASGGSDVGLGLRQVLEEVYDPNGDQLILTSYQNIVRTANADLLSGSTEHAYNVNSNIIQSRAFVALATYVLDQEGFGVAQYQVPDVTIKSPGDALTSFKSALLTPPTGSLFMHNGVTSDGVKWTETASNIVRALDL